jgi:hypothetical protein
MFVRLTNAKRLKAGWLLALVYMLCVLAPGISFAFSDGSLAAPCLTDENHGLGIVRVHELSEASAQHAQKGGHVHKHSATHAHFGQSDGQKDITYVADETPAPANGPHKTSGAQCCGMVCLSALPATITDIVKPAAPTSICAPENYRNVVDDAPPRLYRPPIA